MIERTLVLLKPDAVERSLVGRVVSKLEDAGLKIVGLKMAWVDKSFALRYYTEDLAKRRGEHIRQGMASFLTSGPVIAVAVEGVDAVENVRKLVGATEPKSAAPGTIRGDFSHMSFGHADSKKAVVKNLVHASSSKKEADAEVKLWFKSSELHKYKTVHDAHVL